VTSVYHPGELAVQRLAGVPAQAARVGGIICPAIPPAAAHFLRVQRLAALGSVAPAGRVWASLLTGPPGFMRALDERTLRLEVSHGAGDERLLGNLRRRSKVGILAIEFSTRRRMRLNGRAELRGHEVIHVRPEQVYSNCPRFIHEREVVTPDFGEAVEPSARSLPRLRDVHRHLIAQSDTFFVASFHPEGGADASHRGGDPGFVCVPDEVTILWPDYQGNHMFNTLGNIHAYPHVGLLFINFEEGYALQVAGWARVIWDARRAAEFEGAERVVEFSVEEVVETMNATGLRWRSSARPGPRSSGTGCAA
jgi:uncharacterized protein